MRMTYRLLSTCLFGVAFAVAASGGEPSTAASTGVKPGVVFIAEGVGGFDVSAAAARWAWPRAGVPHEVRQFEWSHGWGHVFKDLQDAAHLVQKARELAAEVRRVKAEDPERPGYLVGKSGGSGLVLLAAEQLPPRTLERIILLSSAVSPAYDLRPALRATKGEIVSFFSPYDQLVLGWGTSQFGSIDRVYGPTAGLRRFQVPPNLTDDDRALYERLVQVPWRPSMLLEGHVGLHTGTSLPTFMRTEVAPWLKTPANR